MHRPTHDITPRGWTRIGWVCEVVSEVAVVVGVYIVGGLGGVEVVAADGGGAQVVAVVVAVGRGRAEYTEKEIWNIRSTGN